MDAIIGTPTNNHKQIFFYIANPCFRTLGDIGIFIFKEFSILVDPILIFELFYILLIMYDFYIFNKQEIYDYLCQMN